MEVANSMKCILTIVNAKKCVRMVGLCLFVYMFAKAATLKTIYTTWENERDTVLSQDDKDSRSVKIRKSIAYAYDCRIMANVMDKNDGGFPPKKTILMLVLGFVMMVVHIPSGLSGWGRARRDSNSKLPQ